jgi:hypothetical protein
MYAASDVDIPFHTRSTVNGINRRTMLSLKKAGDERPILFFAGSYFLNLT